MKQNITQKLSESTWQMYQNKHIQACVSNNMQENIFIKKIQLMPKMQCCLHSNSHF